MWVAYAVPGEYVLQAQAEGCAAKSLDLRVEAAVLKEVAVRLEREQHPR
jgi:hypothetical protein